MFYAFRPYRRITLQHLVLHSPLNFTGENRALTEGRILPPTDVGLSLPELVASQLLRPYRGERGRGSPRRYKPRIIDADDFQSGFVRDRMARLLETVWRKLALA